MRSEGSAGHHSESWATLLMSSAIESHLARSLSTDGRHGEDEQESKQSDMTKQGTEGKSENPKEVEKQSDRNTHPSTTISWDGNPGPYTR